MKAREKFIIFIILFIVISTGVIIVAKINIRKLDYNEYIKTSLYYLLPEKEYKNMYELKDKEIHNSIDNLEEMLLNTEAILIITPIDNPTFIGTGIINDCKIEKVIKGSGFKKNQKIQIYELAAWWKMSDTAYLDGNTPLAKSDRYIVFIKRAPRPNKKDTYIYSSIPYGHIKISDTIDVFENYDESPITIKKAMDYQFIFAEDTNHDLINLYKENCLNLIKKYK